MFDPKGQLLTNPIKNRLFMDTPFLAPDFSDPTRTDGAAAVGAGELAEAAKDLENRSAEEIGDFKEQLYEQIDTAIAGSGSFQPVNLRFVQAGLDLCHLRPNDLLTPDGQRAFIAAMEQQGQPFDYLMFAKLTSGTTVNNNDKQRDYLLTLEIVNIHDGSYDKESAKVRKGYHQSHLGKWRIYNPFTAQR